MSTDTTTAPNKVHWIKDEPEQGNMPNISVPANNDNNEMPASNGASGNQPVIDISEEEDYLTNYFKFDKETLQAIINHPIYHELNMVQRKKVLSMDTKSLNRVLGWLESVSNNNELVIDAPFDGMTDWGVDKDLQHVIAHPKFEYIDPGTKVLIFTLSSENLHRLLDWLIYCDKDPYHLVRKLASLQGTL